MDGQTLHQYPHHKKEGVYDGIYVTHPPERHEELVEQKINWGKKESTPASSTPASTTSTIKRKIGLSSDLKATMAANFQYTKEEADKFCLDAVQNIALN